LAQQTEENGKKPIARLVVPIVVFGAAIGIAGVLWLSNASDTKADECEVSADVLAALDEVTVGQLAAVLPTGTGRGYLDLEFVDENMNPMTLAEFAGKPLLVNFWATWCGPCREEMPALNNLARAYDIEDFQVLTIDLDLGDEGIKLAREFLDELSLESLPLLADPTFAAFERLQKSGVSLGLPTTLLLDAKGCELAVLQGPAEWDSPSAFRLIDTLIEVGSLSQNNS